MRIIGVIPARMASSRFPGKPLARLCGRPMLEHVYRGTAACTLLDEVIVATCDGEIVRAANAFGARAVMTSPRHERATERVAEATAGDGAGIVVMVQGDEPLIRPAMIEAALAPLLEDPSVGCVNLVSAIRSEEELRDPNTIKVAIAGNGRALYFSREPIPAIGARPFTAGGWFKQVCVIPFRRDVLQRFPSLPRGPLEAAESVDMLRLLENGIPVRVEETLIETHAVDVPGDLDVVERLLAADPWTAASGKARQAL